MNNFQKLYYVEMLHNKRLIPVVDCGKLKSIFTFYICNDNSKYLRHSPWEMLSDNPETGTVCYIEQCISDKNVSIPFKIWQAFKQKITEKFPQVKYICWVRYKNGRLYNYSYKLKERELCIQ